MILYSLGVLLGGILVLLGYRVVTQALDQHRDGAEATPRGPRRLGLQLLVLLIAAGSLVWLFSGGPGGAVTFRALQMLLIVAMLLVATILR